MSNVTEKALKWVEKIRVEVAEDMSDDAIMEWGNIMPLEKVEIEDYEVGDDDSPLSPYKIVYLYTKDEDSSVTVMELLNDHPYVQDFATKSIEEPVLMVTINPVIHVGTQARIWKEQLRLNMVTAFMDKNGEPLTYSTGVVPDNLLYVKVNPEHQQDVYWFFKLYSGIIEVKWKE